MNKKKVRRLLDLEIMGSIAGLVLIICAVAGFLNMENAPGFFVLVVGMGVLVNGILAALKYIKQRYVSAVLLTIFTVALLALLVVQLILAEGMFG